MDGDELTVLRHGRDTLGSRNRCNRDGTGDVVLHGWAPRPDRMLHPGSEASKVAMALKTISLFIEIVSIQR